MNSTSAVAEESLRSFGVVQGNKIHEVDKINGAVTEKIISKDFVIRRNAKGEVIRQFEGIDMKAVYEAKPISYKVLKRAFDILASLIGLIILSPIFLITAIAIKLEDGGPVFFSGQRCGKNDWSSDYRER